MNTTRYFHTLTVLRDGRVLAAGGFAPPVTRNETEIYDPATNGWTLGTSLLTPRLRHTATLLADGRVFVTGGATERRPEIYDPSSNTWTFAAPMSQSRIGHGATRLRDGRVLVTGGAVYAGQGTERLDNAEIYDPATDTWQDVGPIPGGGRLDHSAFLMRDSSVLIAAGRNYSTGTRDRDALRPGHQFLDRYGFAGSIAPGARVSGRREWQAPLGRRCRSGCGDGRLSNRFRAVRSRHRHVFARSANSWTVATRGRNRAGRWPRDGERRRRWQRSIHRDGVSGRPGVQPRESADGAILSRLRRPE